jgi:hypothetical protein
MPTAMIFLVLAVIALVLLVLAVVAVGIRREPSNAELSTRAPSAISALTRRLLGVSVRRLHTAEGQREASISGRAK